MLPNADLESVNPKDLMALLDYDRAVKTPYELACMRNASDWAPAAIPQRSLHSRGGSNTMRT